MAWAEIMLWISSLVISSASLIFAFLAASSSSKSNKIIKDFIEKTWTHQEARTFFMIQLRKIDRENDKAIAILKKFPFWNKYYLVSTNTRLLPISSVAQSFLKETKYEPVLARYNFNKKTSDARFASIVDYSNLKDSNVQAISHKTTWSLIEYHYIIKAQIKEMITHYTKIAQQ